MLSSPIVAEASALTVVVSPSLVSITPENWAVLYDRYPDSLEQIKLLETVGMDGFSFGSIVVSDDTQPLLHLPLFRTRLDLASLVDGSAATLVRMIGRAASAVRTLPVWGVGFIEGEWGRIGRHPHATSELLNVAWKLAHRAFGQAAAQYGAGLEVYLNFPHAEPPWLKPALSENLVRFATPPCGLLPLPFATVDDYLKSLSAGTRKDLRRKLRNASQLAMHRVTDLGPWSAEVYRLYQQTAARADIAFGVHRPAYFSEFCKHVPGSHYLLYSLNETLIGFNLLVSRGDVLVDKYFGMDPQAGRAHNLYFVSWMENVRYCIDHGITLYHAGAGSEQTKARLGARFQASEVLFRHRNRLVHSLLSLMTRRLAYRPTVAVDPNFKSPGAYGAPGCPALRPRQQPAGAPSWT